MYSELPANSGDSGFYHVGGDEGSYSGTYLYELCELYIISTHYSMEFNMSLDTMGGLDFGSYQYGSTAESIIVFQPAVKDELDQDWQIIDYLNALYGYS